MVKNAWNRCVSNRVGCSRSFLFSSGIRRTTRRPATRSFFALEVNAVNGTSATSAREIQALVASSKIASVYSIGVHASSAMALIARFTAWSCRAVIDTAAPAFSAEFTTWNP